MESVFEVTQSRPRELRLVGELDLATVAQLRAAFGKLSGEGQVRLDLFELTFIDSTGLHALLTYANSMNGTGPLVLDRVPRSIVRLLELVELATHPAIEIHVSDE